MNSAIIAIVIASILLFVGFIYYQLQKRIGETNAREWVKFKEEHPQWFKKPNPIIIQTDMGANQKKST